VKDVTIDPFTGRKYKLVKVAEHHYRMEVPGSGRIQSTDIIFTEEATIITGDLCPGRNGVVSGMGYGFDFFSVERGSRYLAEKFLSTSWHAEVAHKELDALAEEEDRHPELISELNSLHGLIDDSDIRGLYDALESLSYEAEDLPGYGYKPQDLRILSEINRRFAALLVEQEEVPRLGPELITGSRGKSDAIIRRAAECDGYIVVMTQREAHALARRAKELGVSIRFPLNHDEFISGRYFNATAILIDNAEQLLQRISKVEVVAVSMTASKHSICG